MGADGPEDGKNSASLERPSVRSATKLQMELDGRSTGRLRPDPGRPCQLPAPAERLMAADQQREKSLPLLEATGPSVLRPIRRTSAACVKPRQGGARS